MGTNVFYHVTVMGKCALAESAFERLLATVYSFVTVQLTPLGERLFAYDTFIGILSCVRADVRLQVAHKGAFKVAMRAGVDFLLRMPASMGTQVAGGEERIPAHVASEISFVWNGCLNRPLMYISQLNK